MRKFWNANFEKFTGGREMSTQYIHNSELRTSCRYLFSFGLIWWWSEGGWCEKVIVGLKTGADLGCGQQQRDQGMTCGQLVADGMCWLPPITPNQWTRNLKTPITPNWPMNQKFEATSTKQQLDRAQSHICHPSGRIFSLTHLIFSSQEKFAITV